MTEKKEPDVIDNAEKPLPAFVKAAPELLPLWDWWVKNGKSTIMTLVVAALAVIGTFGVRAYLANRNANASKALSVPTESLAGAVADYGSSSVGMGLKLRLAKSHYDNDRFQDALDVYEAVIKDADKGNPFIDVAMLGKAFALEGLKKYPEAQEAFSAYVADEAKSHDGFRVIAQFGVARCKALQQKSSVEAEAYLKGLKDAATDEEKKSTYDSMLSLLKHYDFSREDTTLLDQFTLPDTLPTAELGSASAPAAKPAAPAPAPAAAKPADPAPAPAAKPAPAPAAAKPAPAAKPAAPTANQ